MIQVSVTELKNKLSKYLRLVKQGETVQVLERSIPIARLEANFQPGSRQDALRERLIRDGTLSPARAKPSSKFLKELPVPCRKDPARVVIEERGDR